MKDNFTFYVQTYGCQMNKNDSEMVAGNLRLMGGRMVADMKDADVVLINTCSVRQHAEDRAQGTIGALKKYVREKGTKVIVMGCMAENMGQKLMEKFPYLLAVVGPNYLEFIPEIIKENKKGVYVGDRDITFELYKNAVRFESHRAYITIVKGCENFCTYCIVPYTRGHIQSRRMGDIIREVKMAVEAGAKEIHLLGQNVNEWGKEWGYKDPSFGDLLREVSKVEGIGIIRYTTPHPKYFGKDLVDTIVELPKVTRYFHLPIQAGDNEVLRLMNRGYTVEEFMDLIDYIKEKAADRYAIGTDVIVGFPGETPEAFENTLKVFERIRFDVAYIAMYSPRPHTAAALLTDKFVPEEEKKRRFDALYALQEKIAWEKNQQYVGTIDRVMVDNYDESKGAYIGRDDINKTVVFTAREGYKPGDIVDVKIEKAKSWVLYGREI